MTARPTQVRIEQRYRAVLEVLDGSLVSEVAVRYGASRQTVYTWKSKHEAEGLGGLREKSRRPRTSPAPASLRGGGTGV
ncbi:hypothetical protein DEH69_22830 [Streptomyces sp. PT12]|nr:hypothetical protein DEH69_22830 [Streptomyces sp. PT12]